MEKNNQNFQDFSIQQAMRLAQSDAGKQLFALLQQTQGQKLQNAMDQAAAGDYTNAKETIQSMMASREAQELMKKLRE